MTTDDEKTPGGDVRAIWALRRAELAVQALKGQRLRTLDMAPAHYSLLFCIHDEPGLTGAEAARRLNVTPQAVASLVTRLEGRGQLERRQHALHRHVQELHLTDAGREAFGSASRIVADIERRVVERLGSDGTAQLTALLGQVVEAVQEP
ncbi:MarR family transcriptional regulator [Streptomyces sp. NPDC002838]|uniref:MarR family winged helix-turn-helix transcriptional regulator n=1 Tax=Streptomyces sp. NPDC002838 TaxID=3154436 RepID=UPI003319C539